MYNYYVLDSGSDFQLDMEAKGYTFGSEEFGIHLQQTSTTMFSRAGRYCVRHHQERVDSERQYF